jgi:hypothetical protein
VVSIDKRQASFDNPKFAKKSYLAYLQSLVLDYVCQRNERDPTKHDTYESLANCFLKSG